MSDYWTPYRPKVGDRVRIRISPECRFCNEDIPSDPRVVAKSAVNGLTGMVVEYPLRLLRIDDPAHVHVVELDRWIWVPSEGRYMWGTVLAAVEMTPLVTDQVPA